MQLPASKVRARWCSLPTANFYGTTFRDGAYGAGTLVEGSHGALYGTTLSGGAASAGSVFEITEGRR